MMENPRESWVVVLGNALVFCIFVGLAADVNIIDFKRKFSFRSKEWRSLAAGICCQFVVMPVIGFAIVKIFYLSEAQSIILLVVASSPGGAFSNWWCDLFNADLALSIAMTTCSTILSLGMLPLNTFVYVKLALGGRTVPVNYGALGVTCGVVLAGTALGLASGHLFPKCKRKLHVLGNVAAVASIVCSFVLSSGGPKADPIWERGWSFYVSLSLMACVGLTLGVLIASLLRLPRPERVALAIETMYQNVSIASSAALTMFANNEHVADALGVPLFYGAVCALVILLFCLVAWQCNWTLAPPSDPLFHVLLRSYQPDHEPPECAAGPDARAARQHPPQAHVKGKKDPQPDCAHQ